jgi:hypothetical protein
MSWLGTNLLGGGLYGESKQSLLGTANPPSESGRGSGSPKDPSQKSTERRNRKMRKGILMCTFSLVLLVTIVATKADAVTYGRAVIWAPTRKHPIEFHKRICEEKVIPRFVAHLKEQYPDVDEEVAVEADEEKCTVLLYVPAGNAKTAIERAKKLAGMAVTSLVGGAESGPRRVLEKIDKERESLKEEIKASEDVLAALNRETGMYDPKKEMESLLSRNSWHRGEGSPHLNQNGRAPERTCREKIAGN